MELFFSLRPLNLWTLRARSNLIIYSLSDIVDNSGVCVIIISPEPPTFLIGFCFDDSPNAPDGLFERIEKESEETCIYKRIKLDYTYGLDRIYTRQEIDKAKTSPSFEREYNLKYLGRIGNVFHTKDIDNPMSAIQDNPDKVFVARA